MFIEYVLVYKVLKSFYMKSFTTAIVQKILFSKLLLSILKNYGNFA